MRRPGALVAGLLWCSSCAAAGAAPDVCPVAAVNLFPAQSWLPPPPPPAPPSRPEPPRAPPLPYDYLGQLQDGREIVLFLRQGAITHVVRRGEILDGAWRLDSIAPRQAGFVYLPLDQPQTLSFPRQP